MAHQANSSRVRPIIQVSISMTRKHWYIQTVRGYASSAHLQSQGTDSGK